MRLKTGGVRAMQRVRLVLLLALLTLTPAALVDRYSDELLRGNVAGAAAMWAVLGFGIGILILLTELVLCLSSADRMKRMRVRLLIGTVAVLLVAAELTLRFGVGKFATWQELNGGSYLSAFGGVLPDWVFVRPPSETAVEIKPEFVYEVKTNSEGLRDVEHTKDKPDGEYRIVALGDSFTEGAGAASEESWPRELQRRLRARYPERNIRVLNAGVSGSDPWFEYILLERRMLSYSPDMVVVAWNISDIFDVIARGGAERFQSDGTVRFRDGPAWEWLYASSHLARLVIQVVFDYNPDLVREDAPESAESIEAIYASMMSFQALSIERGFRLVAVFHPHANEVIQKRTELEPLVRRLRRDTDILVVDLLEYFLDEGLTRDNIWEYYWELDRHHNAKGYALFAKAVDDALAKAGIVVRTQ